MMMTRSTALESLAQTVASNYAEQQEATVQLRASMTSLEEKFSELCNLLTKALVPPVIDDLKESPQNGLNQVRDYDLEPGSTLRSDTDRPRLMDDRDSLIRRIELPLFNGEDAYGWIALAERYFRIGGYSETTKLELVSVSLSGDVLSRFNSEIMRHRFVNWMDFKQRLFARFSKVKLRDPSQPFFNVQQTGNVAEYIHKFEDLSTQVSGLSDTQKEGIFMNGLSPEMREVVPMCKPVDLPDMISTAYQMESSSLFSVVQKEMQRSNNKVGGPSNVSKSYSSFTPHTEWKQKQTPQEKSPQEKNQQTKQPTNTRPTLRLTEAQIAEKKRLGHCFTCDAKWNRQHVCPNAFLRVLTVINDMDMELIDAESAELDEDDIVWEPQLKTISLQSFYGIDSPTTTKLKGIIKKHTMVVMLDSGATHNFISPMMVEQLKLKIDRAQGLEVLLGTGVSVNGTGVCRSVQINLQRVTFTTDFIVLDLGNIDVILGMHWLRTLGKCQIDWEKHEYVFWYNGKQVTLLGDPLLQRPMKSLKMSQASKDVPEELLAVLAKFDHMFQEPTELPPVRGHEHGITLYPGLGMVSVRPYKYPQVHKEVMEKSVLEMLETGIIRPSHSPYSSPVLLV